MKQKKYPRFIFFIALTVSFGLFCSFHMYAAESDTQQLNCTITGSRSVTPSHQRNDTAGGAGALSDTFQQVLEVTTDYGNEVVTIQTSTGPLDGSNTGDLAVSGGSLQDYDLTSGQTDPAEARVIWTNRSYSKGTSDIGDVTFSFSGNHNGTHSSTSGTAENNNYNVVYTVESA